MVSDLGIGSKSVYGLHQEAYKDLGVSLPSTNNKETVYGTIHVESSVENPEQRALMRGSGTSPCSREASLNPKP